MSNRWAWQNSHLTRKIPDEQRISFSHTVTKQTKMGRIRKRPARPSSSLKTYLSNLHLLLRVPGFSRWPLEVHFFCEDVYDVWLKCCTTADAPLRQGLRVVRDFTPQKLNTEARSEGKGRSANGSAEAAATKTGVNAIDPSYKSIKSHIDIGQSFQRQTVQFICSCCAAPVRSKQEMVVVCSHTDCRTAFHMSCLAQRFLGSDANEEVIPVEGDCPSCQKRLKWVDLVRELTLRMRGAKVIDRLMNQGRKRKGDKAAQMVSLVEEDDEASEDDLEDDFAEAVIDEPHKHTVSGHDADDAWETSSASSVTSETRGTSRPGIEALPGATFRIPAVIEDSEEWEGVEVLD